MTKRRDCYIHYVTRISDDSNDTEKKVLFQVNAIIIDESNEAGLSAQNLAFLEQCINRGHLFELGVMCYKCTCPVYTKYAA